MEGKVPTEDMKIGRERALARDVRTTNQLPVYRAAAEVMYAMAEVARIAPRNTVRLMDVVIGTCADLLKGIALANEVHGEDRVYYLGIAMGTTVVLKSYAKMLQKMNLVSKKQHDKMAASLKNVQAQLAGWSNSTRTAGL